MVSPNVHGFVDIVFAASTFALPRRLGWSRRTRSVLSLISTTAVLYSLVTRYPLGLFKWLPLRAHLLFDGLLGLILGVFQFLVTEEETSVRGAIGAFGVASLILAVLTREESHNSAGQEPG